MNINGIFHSTIRIEVCLLLKLSATTKLVFENFLSSVVSRDKGELVGLKLPIPINKLKQDDLLNLTFFSVFAKSIVS